MNTRKAFRPRERGAQQRLYHWLLAVAGLLAFVIIGAPGLALYLPIMFLVHVRSRDAHALNGMEHLLAEHEESMAYRWRVFGAATHRRLLRAPARPPHVLVTVPAFIGVMLTVATLAVRAGDSATVMDVLARLGIALAATLATWVALLGVARSTPIVLGTDGIRIRDTFVAWSNVSECTHAKGRVVLRRGDSLPDVTVETDEQTAREIVKLVDTERARERERRALAVHERPVPAGGFREAAPPVGWRVRVSDAASEEERRNVLARVDVSDLDTLLAETADPTLEDELREMIDRQRSGAK